MIIGANGQLGSELRCILGSNALYADVAELDIADSAAVDAFLAANSPDCVINCAAYTAVDKAEDEEDLAYAINAEGVANLASGAARIGASLIHVSTDYVFSGTGHRPYQADDETSPLGAYGRTKLAGEDRIMETEGLTAAIVRTAWLYSSYGNNFVKTMQRLGRERDSLNVVGDQIGSPTYACDLAEALVSMAKSLAKGERRIYHFTNEGVASWYDFACAIMEMSGIECGVKPISTEEYPTPARRPAYSVLSKKRIKDEFGIEPRHWRLALQECINKLQAQTE